MGNSVESIKKHIQAETTAKSYKYVITARQTETKSNFTTNYKTKKRILDFL